MDVRWLQGTAAALALAVAPAAQARSGTALPMGQEVEGAPSGTSSGTYESGAANAQDVERIEGIVASVSEGAGEASLRRGDVSFTLRGTPMDLRELRPGNHVSLVYRRYGGVPWLLPSGSAGLGGGTGGSGYLQQGVPFATAVGDVQRLDVPQGLVYLDGQAFHGHPAVVGKFRVGQRLTVLYQSFGGTRWISPD
ncbi:MAG TPA: hypothetical protein VGK67_00840 [Myxococcales bacterium]|jgi:hypothetical protein